jgi:hypothetical protein
MQDMAIAKANGIAGGTAAASQNVENTGHTRMMDAAALGTNLAANQTAAANSSTSAYSAAGDSGTKALADTNSGVPQVQTGYSQAIGANYGAGTLYGAAASENGKTAAADNAALGSLGSALGAYAGSSGGSQTISDFANWLSDEDEKSGTGKPMDTKKALDGIVATPVDEGWSYAPEKGGPDEAGQKHDGPMAGEVRKHMGDKVAPGGRMIDAASMNAHLMGAMQELTKRVKRIEKRAA